LKLREKQKLLGSNPNFLNELKMISLFQLILVSCGLLFQKIKAARKFPGGLKHDKDNDGG
jgi:hypothetical protein